MPRTDLERNDHDIPKKDSCITTYYLFYWSFHMNLRIHSR